MLTGYRQARGLSALQIAEHVGITCQAAGHLDSSPSAWRALTYDQLTELAHAYGISLTDLLDTLDRPRRDAAGGLPDDAAKLEAALSKANGPLHRDDIAISWGWTLQRTEAAADSLVCALRARGQALGRPQAGVYQLITRPEILSRHEHQRLQDAIRAAPLQLTAMQASVLRALLDQPHHQGSHELFTDPAEHQAVAELLAADVLWEWDDAIFIRDEVAFSLFLRRSPPDSLIP